MLEEVPVPRVAIVPGERLAVVRVSAAPLQPQRANLTNLGALVHHRGTRRARLHEQEELERGGVAAEHPERPRGVVRVEEVHQHGRVRRSRPEVAPGGVGVRRLIRQADVAVPASEPLGVHGGDLVITTDGVVLF